MQSYKNKSRVSVYVEKRILVDIYKYSFDYISKEKLFRKV
jgi:hypothetical protein